MASPTAERTTKVVVSDEEQHEKESRTISAVHPDILLTHIFPRLDGPDLAFLSCASSHLRLISTQQSLWSDVCRATWPSTNDPRMHSIISNYRPNGPRSFFSHSFPAGAPPPPPLLSPPPSPPPELIFAVDLYCKKKCFFSKVQHTETLTSWFLCSPFRIDFLDTKHTIPTPIHPGGFTCEDLEEDLRMSWIFADPTNGGRACNVSSWRAVATEQHWLSGEILVRFATAEGGGERGTAAELAKWAAAVRVASVRGGGGGDRVEVKEVSLVCEDMEGSSLNGKESLGIVERAMRRVGKRERYEEYLERKREREEKKVRREGALDTVCKAVGVGVAFCVFSTLLALTTKRLFSLCVN